MKQKFLAALEQRYGGALGSKNEIYEKVVTAYGNLITSEEQITDIVAGVEPLLKQFQSVNDKLRAFENKQKSEPTPQPSDTGNNPPEPKPQTEQPDIAAIVAQAVTTAVAPLQEKLNAFETTRAKETAVAALDKFCADWDYAGGFPKERDEAKRIALKVYKAGGEQMSGEQLIAAFREEFDPAVKSKGVTDFSQPFKSDGASGGEADLDMTSVMEIYRKSGRVSDKE